MGKLILCFGDLDWLVLGVLGVNSWQFADVQISSPTECDSSGKLTLLSVYPLVPPARIVINDV